MIRRIIGVAALAGLAAMGAWMLYLSPRAAGTADVETIALGRKVYADHCASCHGVQLEGQPNWRERRADGRLPAPPHDASGHTWHHSGRQLFEITKRGVAGVVPGYKSDMPAYADILSDREIWAVIAFIRSTWPEVIRQRQPRDDAETRRGRSAGNDADV